MSRGLFEKIHIVEAFDNQTMDAAAEGDYVSLKGYDGCLVLIHETRGADATVCRPEIDKATTVSGTDIDDDIAINDYWYIDDIGTSGDVWTKGTAVAAGAGGITGAATQSVSCMYAININADELGEYDCIRVYMAISNVAHNASAVYILYNGRFPKATNLSAIVN